MAVRTEVWPEDVARVRDTYRAEQNGPYSRGPIAFVKLLEGWREEGAVEEMELG